MSINNLFWVHFYLLPVLKLLLTECVVGIHNISREENQNPESNKYRTLLLVTRKE